MPVIWSHSFSPSITPIQNSEFTVFTEGMYIACQRQYLSSLNNALGSISSLAASPKVSLSLYICMSTSSRQYCLPHFYLCLSILMCTCVLISACITNTGLQVSATMPGCWCVCWESELRSSCFCIASTFLHCTVPEVLWLWFLQWYHLCNSDFSPEICYICLSSTFFS